jgi:hypothetical protein
MSFKPLLLPEIFILTDVNIPFVGVTHAKEPGKETCAARA